MLHEGTLKLLSHNQANAALELALKILQCWEKSEEKLSPEILDIIGTIFRNFAVDAVDQKKEFLKAAIIYSSKADGGNPNGDIQLNADMAAFLSSIQAHGDAQRYWLRAGQFAEHASQILAWSRSGNRGERDLFAARAILQYLCLKNLKGANETLANLEQLVKDGSLETPLMNFIRFLLKTCERDAAPLFQVLRRKYSPSLDRDPSFSGYLDKIGEIYFGLQPPRGMLDDILGMFGGPKP